MTAERSTDRAARLPGDRVVESRRNDPLVHCHVILAAVDRFHSAPLRAGSAVDATASPSRPGLTLPTPHPQRESSLVSVPLGDGLQLGLRLNGALIERRRRGGLAAVRRTVTTAA